MRPVFLRGDGLRLRPGAGLAVVPTLVLVLLVLWPRAGSGLDGGVDVQNTTQTGRVGLDEFSTNWLRERLFLAQKFPFGRAWTLDADVRWQREDAGSSLNDIRSSSQREISQGGLSFVYRQESVGFGARGRLFRDESSQGAFQSPLINRRDLGGWARWEPGSHTELWGDLNQRLTKREGGVIGEGEDRDFAGTLNLRQGLGGAGRFRYTLAGLSYQADYRELDQEEISHNLEYAGNWRMLQDRADARVLARTIFFNQTIETGNSGTDHVLLLPLTGGVLLDDTPEVHDPLEDDATPVPELYDRDRVTPTLVNIGDAAPVVRDYGGDYRNLRYDFGVTEEIGSALLLVNQRLPQPGLYQWHVFVTDDPDGRQWNELGADQYTVTYREWDTGYQGWEAVLVGGVYGRFFKMVNVKFGFTVPDLFVTEMEVYTRSITEARTVEARSEDYRIDGGLGYFLTRALRLQYDTALRERVSVGGGRDLSERNHSLQSVWKPGSFTLTGRYSTNKIESAGRSSTDMEQIRAAAARGLGSSLETQLSWDQTRDRGSGRDFRTNTTSFLLGWRIWPRLRWSQRVNYAQRWGIVDDPNSDAWSLITSIDSRPARTVILTFNRSDRWVTVEAGTGFQNFNDTGINLTWSIFPLLTFSSLVQQQARERTDYNTRNFLTWSPLRGGTVDLFLTANHLRDTRTDTLQRGVTFGAKWRARAGLMVDGSLSYQRLETAGLASNPFSTFIHAGFTF